MTKPQRAAILSKTSGKCAYCGNPLEVFRQSVARQVEILRRDRPTFRLAERYGLIKCKPVDRVVFYFEML